MPSRADIARRHVTVAGELAAAALIGAAAHWTPAGWEPSTLVPLLGKLFVASFGTFVVATHVKYLVRAREHQLEVSPTSITFRTGGDVSVLPLDEVAHTERHERFREGPSLMLTLENKRHVRLTGYDEQARLTELVEGHVARLRGSE